MSDWMGTAFLIVMFINFDGYKLDLYDAIMQALMK